VPPVSRRERFITDSAAYTKGFQDGKAAANNDLTMDDVRAMTPQQYIARKPEVDDFLRSQKGRS